MFDIEWELSIEHQRKSLFTNDRGGRNEQEICKLQVFVRNLQASALIFASGEFEAFETR